MREINLPLPFINKDELVEIKLTINKDRIVQNFRIEQFKWDSQDELSGNLDKTSISLARITRLKKLIENYDKSWELIQIFAPLENSEFIRVLYRKIE